MKWLITTTYCYVGRVHGPYMDTLFVNRHMTSSHHGIWQRLVVKNKPLKDMCYNEKNWTTCSLYIYSF